MAISYGLSKCELMENFKDEDFISEYEEKINGKILYGAYEGDAMIKLRYSPIKFGKIDGENTWKINNEEISYERFENKGYEFIFTGMDLGERCYRIMYLIGDDFEEEEAKEFTEFILNELNKNHAR